MKNELEQYDLATLLSMYVEESRAFSEALGKGASWQELRDKHMRIREISECINLKYRHNSNVDERRRDNLPPHSSNK